jgi:uncharacterized protein YkwD
MKKRGQWNLCSTALENFSSCLPSTVYFIYRNKKKIQKEKMRTIIFLLIIVTFYVVLSNKKNLEVSFNETDPITISNLLEFHNIERTRLELGALELDFQLMLYAQQHAQWMATKNSLKHSDLSNIKNFNINGENIAWNQSDEQEVITAWMNSTGHRKNILNPKFKKVGFGIAKNLKNEPYWCTVFGG